MASLEASQWLTRQAVESLQIEKLHQLLQLAYAPVSYTHLRAHETVLDIVCRLLLEKKQHSHSSTIQNDCNLNRTIAKKHSTNYTTHNNNNHIQIQT